MIADGDWRGEQTSLPPFPPPARPATPSILLPLPPPRTHTPPPSLPPIREAICEHKTSAALAVAQVGGGQVAHNSRVLFEVLPHACTVILISQREG